MRHEPTIEKFKLSLQGELIQPGDRGYDESRKVWNGMIDKHPAFIVRCRTENDVINAVQFANQNSLPLAVRGGGHNVAGFGTCDDGIVIDLSPMKAIIVDPNGRTALAQGGLTWGDFDKATQSQALATTGGLISTTGIAGFTLGGGIGWLMRKYGLALDNLLSVRLVTAEGNCIAASKKENADLFWGIRGGGGNFGIITEFTFQLHPVGPVVYGGVLFHPLSRAKEFLHYYRRWVRTLPDEMSALVVFLTAPPEPFIPEYLRGTPMIAMGVCYTGDHELGEALMKPIREFIKPAVDMLGPIPYTALQSMFDTGAPKGILSYWKSEYLRNLDDLTIDEVIRYVGKMGAPNSQVHILYVEGAASRVDDDATSFGHRDAPFILHMIGMWTDPAETETQIEWARAFANGMKPYSTGSKFLNFLGDEGEAQVRAAYGEKKYARLVKLKNRFDPSNVFHLNHNIKPTV